MDTINNPTAIIALYYNLLDCWNRRTAEGMAALFEEAGHVVGFDGSTLCGQAHIEAEMERIFFDHQTSAYVGKVREVRFLSPDVAMLRAVAGMIAPNQTDINPAVNAMQTLVATHYANQWRISLFQNTPAQFHGRPEQAAALTEELRQLLTT